VLTRTIPSQHKKLAEYTILDSLKLPNPPPPLRFPRHANGFTVQVFWDSDIGKWIEAASYALSHKRDADIEDKIEAIVDDFEKAQAPDGYLNCWYLGVSRRSAGRTCATTTSSTMPAICWKAPSPITRPPAGGAGSTSWSAISNTIRQNFGTGPGQKRGYCGHQEIELALMKLYHLTKEKKHLDLAAYFINERGNPNPHYFDVEREEREKKGWEWQRYVQGTTNTASRHKPVRDAGQGGRARGARHVHVYGDGRPRGRAQRCGASRRRARRCGRT
jgi:DUF1680 family protein